MDFGLGPTEKPRPRPVGHERLQIKGVTSSSLEPMADPDGEPAKPPTGSSAAFVSPLLRPEKLYESPRAMKARTLRSAPRNLGFCHPDKTPRKLSSGGHFDSNDGLSN